MRKYGRENFTFSILEECQEEDLKKREIYWIAKLDSYHTGYNETYGGDLLSPEYVLRGEAHGMARLTEEEVRSCRKLYAEGAFCREVWEKQFSDRITFTGFQRMWHGKTWKHIMPEVFEHNPHPKTKFSKEMLADIKRMYAEGNSCATIYHLYNDQYGIKISRTSINDICHDRR